MDPSGATPRPTLFDEETAAPPPDRARFRWLAVVLLTFGAIVGGVIGWYYTRDEEEGSASESSTETSVPVETLPAVVTVDPDAPTSSVPGAPTSVVEQASTTIADTTTTVAATTVAAPTTVAASTTVAGAVATTLAPLPTNPTGASVGVEASSTSWNAAERWAALLGTTQAEAAVSSPAALYTRWFRLAVGPADLVEVTDPGFRLTFINGTTVELIELSAAGGKVADLVECPGGTVANACQRISQFVDLASLQLAGTAPSASARWFGRVRLRNSSWGLYSMVTTKPVASVSAAYPASFDGVTLMVTGAPAGATPGIPLTITYTDATVEEMILSV
jgi:hypothetical protein